MFDDFEEVFFGRSKTQIGEFVAARRKHGKLRILFRQIEPVEKYVESGPMPEQRDTTIGVGGLVTGQKKLTHQD